MRKKMDTYKILKTFLIFNLLTMANFAIAGENKSICDIYDIPYKRQVKVNDLPSFFFKVHPNGEYIGYIGQKGNKLLNLNTGHEIFLPGYIDPTFSTDGKFLIVPMSKDQLASGEAGSPPDYSVSSSDKDDFNTAITFFDFDLFVNLSLSKSIRPEMTKKAFQSPSIVDLNNTGVYQSTSVKGSELKLLTDQDGASSSTFQTGANQQVTSVSAPQKMCKNVLKFKTDLPMLSKDGNFISIFNDETNTTQIYKLGENNNCELSLDLGIATGKVSFNADSSQVTFHIDRFGKPNGGYFSGVASDISKEVFVLNLDQKKNGDKTILVPTTWARASRPASLGDGSYYSDFDSNGDIHFLSDQNNYFEFVQVDQKKLNFVPFMNNVISKKKIETSDKKSIDCIKINEDAQSPFLIGLMWNKVCSKINVPNAEEVIFNFMSLDKNNCEELVKSQWGNLTLSDLQTSSGQLIVRPNFSSVNLRDLLAACPKSKPLAPPTVVVGAWKEKSSAEFKEVLKQKCLVCHSREIDYEKDLPVRHFYNEKNDIVKTETAIKKIKLTPFNPDAIDIKLAAKFIKAIKATDPKLRMPKVGSLNKEEKELFDRYYKELRLSYPTVLEPTSDYETSYLYSEDGLKKYYEDNYVTTNKAFLTTGDPTAVAAWVKNIKKIVWCQMGQQKCPELIADKILEKRAILESEKKDLGLIESEIKTYEQSMRCYLQYQTVPGQCLNVTPTI